MTFVRYTLGVAVSTPCSTLYTNLTVVVVDVHDVWGNTLYSGFSNWDDAVVLVPQSVQQSSGGSLSTSIGVGVGVGVAFLLLVVAAVVVVRRRRRHASHVARAGHEAKHPNVGEPDGDREAEPQSSVSEEWDANSAAEPDSVSVSRADSLRGVGVADAASNSALFRAVRDADLGGGNSGGGVSSALSLQLQFARTRHKKSSSFDDLRSLALPPKRTTSPMRAVSPMPPMYAGYSRHAMASAFAGGVPVASAAAASAEPAGGDAALLAHAARMYALVDSEGKCVRVSAPPPSSALHTQSPAAAVPDPALRSRSRSDTSISDVSVAPVDLAIADSATAGTDVAHLSRTSRIYSYLDVMRSSDIGELDPRIDDF